MTQYEATECRHQDIPSFSALLARSLPPSPPPIAEKIPFKQCLERWEICSSRHPALPPLSA